VATPSALSARRQPETLCRNYDRPDTAILVKNVVVFGLYYVLVRGNSSANLYSVPSSRVCARLPVLTAHLAGSAGDGDPITARITKMHKDWR